MLIFSTELSIVDREMVSTESNSDAVASLKLVQSKAMRILQFYNF